ncbi:MAG: hypothetical protein VR72_03785 [Clostridiaceae bacterium BRH_c20a]|nr:MAG: hypothetical protein VR72_03785 [Clostridiaceae bacterium BRH_c20a]
MQQKICVIYARVSTQLQNIEFQVSSGKRIANTLAYDEQDIVILADDGISSLSKKAEERDALSQLHKLIKMDRVAVLIVFDRDRLARHMFEYLILVEDIIKNNVEVIFSNPCVEKFSKVLSREAELGLDAEVDGKRIAARNREVRKYYPSAPYGYLKIGKKGETRYVFAEHIAIVRTLFDDFKFNNSKKDFQIFKKKWQKKIKGNIEKILTNPFYSAHVGTEFEKVHHIEPIVDINLIKENIEKINIQWGYGLKKPVLNDFFFKQLQIPIICGICKKSLVSQTSKSNIHYKCPEHKKIKISQIRLNELVLDNLKYSIKTIDPDVIRQKSIAQINTFISKLEKEKREFQIKLTEVSLSNQRLRNNHDKLKLALTSFINIKNIYEEINDKLEKLKDLKVAINEFTSDVIRNANKSILSYSIDTLRALIISIEVGQVDVRILNRVGFFNSDNYNTEVMYYE